MRIAVVPGENPTSSSNSVVSPGVSQASVTVRPSTVAARPVGGAGLRMTTAPANEATHHGERPSSVSDSRVVDRRWPVTSSA